MNTSQTSLAEAIETLTGEYRIAAASYIEYLAQEQRNNARETLPNAVAKKRQFGSARGSFVCPQDFDEDNEEIARMFGAV